MALILTSSACGTSRSPPSTSDTRQSPDVVRAYARITRQTFVVYERVARRAAAILDANFNACPVVQTRGGLPLGLHVLSRLNILERIGLIRAFYPRYLAFGNQLRTFRSHDAILESVPNAMATVAAYFRPVLKIRTTQCQVLRQWKAAGWKRNFDVVAAVKAGVLIKSVPARVRDARERIVQAQARLGELGMSTPTENLFRELAELPGSE